MSERPKLIVLGHDEFLDGHRYSPELKQVLKRGGRTLSINDEEARQLSGDYSLLKAAKTIMNMGPKHLIIKKGEHGALLFSSNEVFFAPALPLKRFSIQLELVTPSQADS